MLSLYIRLLLTCFFLTLENEPFEVSQLTRGFPVKLVHSVQSRSSRFPHLPGFRRNSQVQSLLWSFLVSWGSSFYFVWESEYWLFSCPLSNAFQKAFRYICPTFQLFLPKGESLYIIKMRPKCMCLYMCLSLYVFIAFHLHMKFFLFLIYLFLNASTNTLKSDICFNFLYYSIKMIGMPFVTCLL